MADVTNCYSDGRNTPADSSDNTTDKSGAGDAADESAADADVEREIGGRDGPDPTRYGDWEKNGRCIDF